jgi:hypothetical protein
LFTITIFTVILRQEKEMINVLSLVKISGSGVNADTLRPKANLPTAVESTLCLRVAYINGAEQKAQETTPE